MEKFEYHQHHMYLNGLNLTHCIHHIIVKIKFLQKNCRRFVPIPPFFGSLNLPNNILKTHRLCHTSEFNYCSRKQRFTEFSSVVLLVVFQLCCVVCDLKVNVSDPVCPCPSSFASSSCRQSTDRSACD